MAVNCYYRHTGDMLTKRISANIMRLREAQGLSRPELGRRMIPPTSGQQVERLEKSQRSLTVDWIERIAEALEVDPAALVAGESGQFMLTEPVAAEIARTIGRIVLRGAEPDPLICQDLAVLLQELSEMFARHPATRSDLQAARPAIGLLGRRRGPQ